VRRKKKEVRERYRCLFQRATEGGWPGKKHYGTPKEGRVPAEGKCTPSRVEELASRIWRVGGAKLGRTFSPRRHKKKGLLEGKKRGKDDGHPHGHQHQTAVGKEKGLGRIASTPHRLPDIRGHRKKGPFTRRGEGFHNSLSGRKGPKERTKERSGRRGSAFPSRPFRGRALKERKLSL